MNRHDVGIILSRYSTSLPDAASGVVENSVFLHKQPGNSCIHNSGANICSIREIRFRQ